MYYLRAQNNIFYSLYERRIYYSFKNNLYKYNYEIR